MASPLILAIDRQNIKLISTALVVGSVVAMPKLFQGNTRFLEITVLDPAGTFGSGSYSKVDLSSSSLRVSIGSTPTGTAGGPTPLALQTSFTWDSLNSKFTGSLALNVAAIDSYIGTSASAEAYFEVNIVDAGSRITILQERVILVAVVDEATATAPSTSESYFTGNESDARYVLKQFLAGDAILMKSADGTKRGLIYWGDDGSFHADPIT
jgi:hypothetical protein